MTAAALSMDDALAGQWFDGHVLVQLLLGSRTVLALGGTGHRRVDGGRHRTALGTTAGLPFLAARAVPAPESSSTRSAVQPHMKSALQMTISVCGGTGVGLAVQDATGHGPWPYLRALSGLVFGSCLAYLDHYLDRWRAGPGD